MEFTFVSNGHDEIFHKYEYMSFVHISNADLMCR